MEVSRKEQILKDDTETAEELNLFFSNAAKSLNIAGTLISQAMSLII